MSFMQLDQEDWFRGFLEDDHFPLYLPPAFENDKDFDLDVPF